MAYFCHHLLLLAVLMSAVWAVLVTKSPGQQDGAAQLGRDSDFIWGNGDNKGLHAEELHRSGNRMTRMQQTEHK